jgi:hypothetical protein
MARSFVRRKKEEEKEIVGTNARRDAFCPVHPITSLDQQEPVRFFLQPRSAAVSIRGPKTAGTVADRTTVIVWPSEGNVEAVEKLSRKADNCNLARPNSGER